MILIWKWSVRESDPNFVVCLNLILFKGLVVITTQKRKKGYIAWKVKILEIILTNDKEIFFWEIPAASWNWQKIRSKHLNILPRLCTISYWIFLMSHTNYFFWKKGISWYCLTISSRMSSWSTLSQTFMRFYVLKLGFWRKNHRWYFLKQSRIYHPGDHLLRHNPVPQPCLWWKPQQLLVKKVLVLWIAWP